MLVGVGRCGLKVRELEAVIGRGVDSASRRYAEAAGARRGNPRFAAIAEEVTHALRKSEKKLSRGQSIQGDTFYE